MANDNDGRCVCGHKMHKLEHPHACWGGPHGTCRCPQFCGIDGSEFDQTYVRGGSRSKRGSVLGALGRIFGG